MTSPRVRNMQDALLHDALLGESIGADLQPPTAALRMVNRRCRRRHAARGAAASLVLTCMAFTSWWAFQREAGPPVSLPSKPNWMVVTQEIAEADIVRTQGATEIVRTATELPPGLVVYTRPGLFVPLSDEGLFAMFADRSPVLIGNPGERHLIFMSDEVRQ